MDKKFSVLICGDRIVDNLIVGNKNPVYFNEPKRVSLLDDDIKYIEDETGFLLIEEVLNVKKDDSYKVLTLDLSPGKAFKTYSIWNKNNSKCDNPDLYFMNSFLGSDYSVYESKIKDSGMKRILEKEGYDLIVISDSGNPENRHNEVEEILDKSLENGHVPYIIFRTLYPPKGNEKWPIIEHLNTCLKNYKELRKKTILILKHGDLKQLSRNTIPSALTWDDLIINTYRELKKLRNEKRAPIFDAFMTIVEFDYDGFALFQFDTITGKEDKEDIIDVVFNKKDLNGSGFEAISCGRVLSNVSITQSILSYIILLMLKSGKEITVDAVITALKASYSATYYYGTVGRKLNDGKMIFPSNDIYNLFSYGINTDELIKEDIKENKINPNTDMEKLIKMYRPEHIRINYKQSEIKEIINAKDGNRGKSFLDFAKAGTIKNEAAYDIDEYCKNIVEKGIDKLEGIPILEYEGLLSIERSEIKNYRRVYNLMLEYIKKGNTTPLSICVLGSPGSGKSYGIDQIAKYIKKNSDANLDSRIFNLTQMKEVDDLYLAFIKISDIGLRGKIPIIFWDEFDSQVDGNDYFWLKHFLRPLNDGEFLYKNDTHVIGKSIFIFAGSNNESWEKFNIEAEKTEYENTKISDFISRINGYIDVLILDFKKVKNSDKKKNINTKKTEISEIELKESCKLRRAVLIRKNIEKSFRINRNEEFIIDGDVLRAMLNVGKYKHGNRSLKLFIDKMKASCENKMISRCDIPEQLDLYVDEEDFKRELNSEES